MTTSKEEVTDAAIVIDILHDRYPDNVITLSDLDTPEGEDLLRAVRLGKALGAEEALAYDPKASSREELTRLLRQCHRDQMQLVEEAKEAGRQQGRAECLLDLAKCYLPGNQATDSSRSYTWDDVISEIDWLIAHAEPTREKLAAAEEMARSELLMMDKPWPLPNILRRLSQAADHLLRFHSCDAHGYEGVEIAITAAKAWLREHAEETPT